MLSRHLCLPAVIYPRQGAVGLFRACLLAQVHSYCTSSRRSSWLNCEICKKIHVVLKHEQTYTRTHVETHNLADVLCVV